MVQRGGEVYRIGSFTRSAFAADKGNNSGHLKNKKSKIKNPAFCLLPSKLPG